MIVLGTILTCINSVYIAGKVLHRLLQTYPNDKVAGQQAVSEKKAQLIYAALDAFPDIYKVVPDKSVRSNMNICFRVTKGDVDTAEKTFLKEATASGLTGLKGHRSVGGIRASKYVTHLVHFMTVEYMALRRYLSYNSVPLEGAEKLVSFIRAFATS